MLITHGRVSLLAPRYSQIRGGFKQEHRHTGYTGAKRARAARSLGLISRVCIPPPRILHVLAVLSDGTVLTELELVPALLDEEQGGTLAGWRECFLFRK